MILSRRSDGGVSVILNGWSDGGGFVILSRGSNEGESIMLNTDRFCFPHMSLSDIIYYLGTYFHRLLHRDYNSNDYYSSHHKYMVLVL